MALKLSNNASTILAADIDDAVTTVPILPGDAGLFPTLSEGDWFPITVYDQDGNMEIMKVTARVGGDLTVERGQEGTTAKAFSANDRVDIRVTGAVFEYLQGMFDIFTPYGMGLVEKLNAGATLDYLGAGEAGKGVLTAGNKQAARDAIGAVSSSGDTMTGDLVISNGTGTTRLGTAGRMQVNGDSWATVVRSNSGTYNLNINGNATSLGGRAPNRYVKVDETVGANEINIAWDGSHLQLRIDTSYQGWLWPIDISGVSSVTECKPNSGTTEYGPVDVGGGNFTFDAPGNVVMTGLRSIAGDGLLYPRGKTMRTR